MALTDLQRRICRLLAERRVAHGESYVAGGAALQTLLGADLVSRDIDVFADSAEAVREASSGDLADLARAKLAVEVLVERTGFVEALVSDATGSARVEWAADSAYRFFPLMTHPDLGLTLHPIDAATNKALALVGRSEPRDWVDLIECHRRLQPLGYLIWAAVGKDPGLSPAFVLDQAARTARYTEADLEHLQFGGVRPTAADLSCTFRAALAQARAIVALLPPDSLGQCVLTAAGAPAHWSDDELPAMLPQLRFHSGALHGAFPSVKPA